MKPSKPVVLVTGGARGIGSAICQHYVAKGWTVEAPTRQGLDVSNARSIHQYFLDHPGPLHALVNCAGMNPISLISSTSEDDLEEIVAVNLLGPFRLLRDACPRLKATFGTKYVVNIGSIWSGVSKPGRGAYAMTKTGLLGLTRTAALEWAPFGILVNTIAPGFTLTDLTTQNNSPEALTAIEQQIPLGRLARPEEIAGSVYLLGSELNTYITGQTVFVDGGYTCQ